jgi:hypothetical protein
VGSAAWSVPGSWCANAVCFRSPQKEFLNTIRLAGLLDYLFGKGKYEYEK